MGSVEVDSGNSGGYGRCFIQAVSSITMHSLSNAMMVVWCDCFRRLMWMLWWSGFPFLMVWFFYFDDLMYFFWWSCELVLEVWCACFGFLVYLFWWSDVLVL